MPSQLSLSWVRSEYAVGVTSVPRRKAILFVNGDTSFFGNHHLWPKDGSLLSSCQFRWPVCRPEVDKSGRWLAEKKAMFRGCFYLQTVLPHIMSLNDCDDLSLEQTRHVNDPRFRAHPPHTSLPHIAKQAPTPAPRPQISQSHRRTNPIPQHRRPPRPARRVAPALARL
jgi:hypothetical protein